MQWDSEKYWQDRKILPEEKFAELYFAQREQALYEELHHAPNDIAKYDCLTAVFQHWQAMLLQQQKPLLALDKPEAVNALRTIDAPTVVLFILKIIETKNACYNNDVLLYLHLLMTRYKNKNKFIVQSFLDCSPMDLLAIYCECAFHAKEDVLEFIMEWQNECEASQTNDVMTRAREEGKKIEEQHTMKLINTIIPNQKYFTETNVSAQHAMDCLVEQKTPLLFANLLFQHAFSEDSVLFKTPGSHSFMDAPAVFATKLCEAVQSEDLWRVCSHPALDAYSLSRVNRRIETMFDDVLQSLMFHYKLDHPLLYVRNPITNNWFSMFGLIIDCVRLKPKILTKHAKIGLLLLKLLQQYPLTMFDKISIREGDDGMYGDAKRVLVMCDATKQPPHLIQMIKEALQPIVPWYSSLSRVMTTTSTTSSINKLLTNKNPLHRPTVSDQLPARWKLVHDSKIADGAEGVIYRVFDQENKINAVLKIQEVEPHTKPYPIHMHLLHSCLSTIASSSSSSSSSSATSSESSSSSSSATSSESSSSSSATSSESSSLSKNTIKPISFSSGSYFTTVFVPMVYDAFERDKKLFLFMEEYTSDVRHACFGFTKDGLLKYGQSIDASLVKCMFWIAHQMTNYNVVHGDLKPDQFLLRTDAKTGLTKIAVTDFGFSGWVNQPQSQNEMTLPQLGWLQDSMARFDDNTKELIPSRFLESCKWFQFQHRGRIQETHPLFKYRAYINVWHLHYWFMTFGDYITMDNKPYGGVDACLLPPEIEDQLAIFFNNAQRYVQRIREIRKQPQQNVFVVSFT